MATPAFTKFDPRAFLANEKREEGAAKVAKPANALGAEPERSATFATLASLANGQHKAENFAPSPSTWTDAQEERAAIIEHDGGVPRAWAEGFARLDPSTPPADVPPTRWLRFIEDCGRFLDNGGIARAAALGWGALDLFGCDRERRFARLDPSGLLWVTDGGTVVELHRDHAIIQTASRARRSYRRQPVEVGRVVLAWELAE